ncbi:hypothetical protein ACJX0J_012985, partial [Zea mays]
MIAFLERSNNLPQPEFKENKTTSHTPLIDHQQHKVLGIGQSITHRARYCLSQSKHHHLAFCCPIGRMIVNLQSSKQQTKNITIVRLITKNITSTINIATSCSTELLRYYPSMNDACTVLECVWIKDKFVLHEKCYGPESTVKMLYLLFSIAQIKYQDILNCFSIPMSITFNVSPSIFGSITWLVLFIEPKNITKKLWSAQIEKKNITEKLWSKRVMEKIVMKAKEGEKKRGTKGKIVMKIMLMA